MKELIIKEIRKEIEELENRIFLLEMVDRWTQEDFDLSKRLNNELKELNKQLDNELNK